MEDTRAQEPYIASVPCNIPAEVIAIIISQVDDRKTFSSLCLANRFVWYEAVRWLYRDVDDVPYKAEFHLKRLSSIASNPKLPPLVQSFSLLRMTRPARYSEEALRELIGGEKDFTKRMILVEQLLSLLLEKVLPSMINLKRLEYGSRRPMRETGDLLYTPEGSVVVFQLRMLRWGNSWDDSFIDFIRTQKWLKALALGSVWCSSEAIINYRLPQDVCDRLTALSGDQRVVEAILPFAPGVKSVELDIGRPNDQRGLFGPKVDMKATGHLAKAMPQLTRLILHNYSTRTPISTFGPEALSGLRVLVVDCMLDEHESADTTFIGQLPTLELFVQIYNKPGGVVEWCRRAKKLLNLSTSLKEVVMLSYDPGLKEAPRPFWFLLRRGDLLPRKLNWPEKRRHRFFMPVDELDAADPGWIDEGSLPIPPDAQQILQG